MVLRGLVLVCPPPPPPWRLLYSLVRPVEWILWSYDIWYCCAPSLPLDTALFSRLTVEGRVWSYGVWYSFVPSLPVDTARGLVLL